MRQCLICASKQFRPPLPYLCLNDPSGYLFGGRSIIECVLCSHHQIDPIPQQADLDHYYEDVYRSGERWRGVDIGQFPFDSAFYLSRGRAIRKLVGKVIEMSPDRHLRVLDVGAGFGHVLYAFREAIPKVELFASEPDPRCRPFLEKCGVHVLSKLVDGTRNVDVAEPYGPFDVLVLSHILEHLPDPVASLRGLAQLVRKDGVALIEVPNCPSAFFRQWDVVPHLSFFRAATLQRCSETAGATTLEIRSCGGKYDRGSLLRRLVPPRIKDVLKSIARSTRRTGRANGSHHRDLATVRENPDVLPIPAFEEYGRDRVWLRGLIRFP